MKIILCLLLAGLVFAQDPIPGVNQGIGAGFDMKLERIRMPLFQWTYSYGQTWKNPYTGDVFSYPDQMYLTEIPRGTVTKLENTYSEFHEYVTGLTTSFGVDVGLGYKGKPLADLAFKESHGHFDDIVKGGVNNFGQEKRYNPMYQLDVWPDTDYNTHIKAMIANLPSTISNALDSQKYAAFVQAVGTHYCMSAQFGGFINFTSIFQTSMSSRHTQDWTAYQVKLSLTWQEIKVGIDWARNKSTDKLDKDYSEHSFNETDCVGGLCAYLDEDAGYDKWIQSVIKNPGLLPAYQIMFPITDLVIGNDLKKETLRQYVINYVSNATTVF